MRILCIPRDRERLIKSTVPWTVQVGLTKMPFPEESCFISVFPEQFRNRHSITIQVIHRCNGMCNTCKKFMCTCHQGCTGRGTGWTHRKIGKPGTLGTELIEMGCPEYRVAMGSNVTVTHVINQDQDYIYRF